MQGEGNMAVSLPVSDLVIGALNRVFRNLPQVFKVGLLPMIAAFVVIIAGALIGIATGSQFLLLLGSLSGYAVLGFFALAWLRLLLQGSKGEAADAAKFEIGPREQKFFAYYGLLLVPVLL